VRLRLTLLYGGLFVLSGAILLGITYGLVREATDGTYVYRGSKGTSGAVVQSPRGSSGGKPPDDATLRTESGSENLTPAQARTQARQLETLAKQQHDDQLKELLTQSAIALGIMTLVSLVVGWFIAGRVLRPLRTITATTRSISATNLHERLALDGPDDELKELGDTIDELLARLETTFDAQRAFVANASHELRTPLARQRTIAQVALADPDASIDSMRAAHERVLVAGQQQERLIEALLTLTRGQAGLAHREPFDLATVTDTVLQGRCAEAGQLDLHLDPALKPAPTAGDPPLAERLVTNLVENAIRHNRRHGRIEISTNTNNGDAILSIVNDGPNIPPSELARLFEPLQRLDPARSSHPDGHGLGLSIVQAIADAHNATIAAQTRPSGGLAIEIRFPVATRPQLDSESSSTERPVSHEQQAVSTSV
jgi:signal transduction histidine kinase